MFGVNMHSNVNMSKHSRLSSI